MRVVNVGAGQGTFSQLLEQRGFLVTSVDPSAEALELLRERCAGAVVSAEAARLPFPGESFDVAVLGEVLEHLEDDAAALREVRRVVRSGGLVLVSVPANPDWFGPSDEWAGHKRRYTRRALLDLCVNAGLAVERLRPWGFPVSSLYHRFLYEPRLAKVGPKLPPRHVGKAVLSALDIALQIDRLFVGVEWGALGYLLLARKPTTRLARPFSEAMKDKHFGRPGARRG